MSEDPRVAWLRENVLPIRSIDPDDENFKDFEPLRAALDGVRLLLLGEADHQSGSDFLVKTRLVKFLHQELGFDVLVFESPMYDMMVAWDSLRTGMLPGEAFWLGAGTWAGASQMQPLVAYLGEHARGARPLEIAGCDHQHQVASSFYFADDLARFLSVRGVGGPLVDRESPEHGVLQALSQVHYRYRLAPRPDVSMCRAFLAAVEKSLVAVGAMPDERARQWAQILRNLACHTRFVLRHDEIGSCNRDEQMAENLLWFANERYPDRKIIVWAGTVHAARAPEPPPFLRDQPWAAPYFPSMGQRIGEVFGSKSYVIGVTSYRSARAGIVADQDPLPEFEELMAAAGFDYGLLDLRRAAAEEGWAGGEFLARAIGHISGAAVWSDLLDALLFVRERELRQDAEQPAADIEAINEVRERESTAFLGGDADSYIALFTDDCVVMPPGGSRIRGRAALRAWFEGVHDQSAFANGKTKVLETIVVAGCALDLYAASSTLTPRAGGEAVEKRYMGMHIYRRQPDGMWQIVQEIWNERTRR
ncbi:MAG: SgcJ/EcaC family oxidoreductase [Planctomycetota bacterium]